MKIKHGLLAALATGAVALVPATSTAEAPIARAAATCADYPTREGQDRDEYPPAVGRGKGAGLERGRNPRGWKADVRYVPSSENRSHGAALGAKLDDFCNGTRFRYVFR